MVWSHEPARDPERMLAVDRERRGSDRRGLSRVEPSGVVSFIRAPLAIQGQADRAVSESRQVR